MNTVCVHICENTDLDPMYKGKIKSPELPTH